MNSGGTKIKICGLTREEDISAVNAALPDYIGFVFAPSRRQITPERAKKLKELLDGRIKTVGIFVNADQEYIADLLSKNIIDTIQLHGQEDKNYIASLRDMTKRTAIIIKAVSVRHKKTITAWNESVADFLLLDSGTGGTGKRFNWEHIKECKKPFFLAGGIDTSNIGEALNIRPYCIDISSGAETDGLKDKEKIFLLTEKVRERRNG